nr:cytochrome c oxidase assembly protein [Thermobifida halotolerans]
MLVAAAAAAACLIALILAMLLGGAGYPQISPGLPDPGALTRWGLPVARAAMDVSAALTVGLLVLAVFLLPLHQGTPGEQARSYVRAASWAALVWAAAAGAALVFQLSDILGRPVTEVVGNEITSYASSVPQGIGLTLTVLAALGVALIGRTTTGAAATVGLTALALVGLLPPALTGHASSSGSHEMAIVGLSLHVLTVSVWVGGLAALTFHALRGTGEHVPTAVRRFSTMALWVWIGVALSGAASAASRLYTVGELFTTAYGQLMLAKTAAFLALGVLGWAHRAHAVPRIAEEPGRRLFLRFAGVEIVLMAAAMGLAAALSRTAPPPDLTEATDAFRNLAGFAMPPPMSPQTLLTLWRPDLFFILVIGVLAGLYTAGVVRLLRRGDTWPRGRTVAWLAGLLALAGALLSGVGTYSYVLFSVHMVQHMVLSMLVPILLVLGAPVTLALRALRPAHRRGDRGPREWLNAFLHSRYSRLVTHPGFATPVFVFSVYVLYFTPLFGTLMQDHLGHMFMNVHFLLAGFLFYWIMIGVDPAPRKVPFLLRIVLLLVAMGFHAFFGIVIMMQSAPLGMEYYGQFEVPWLDDLAEDQYAGGGVAWAVGEIPTLLVLIALVVQWSRDEERAERRRERHSRRDGSEDADLDAYNAYLASLERRAKKREEREERL